MTEDNQVYTIEKYVIFALVIILNAFTYMALNKNENSGTFPVG